MLYATSGHTTACAVSTRSTTLPTRQTTPKTAPTGPLRAHNKGLVPLMLCATLQDTVSNTNPIPPSWRQMVSVTIRYKG